MDLWNVILFIDMGLKMSKQAYIDLIEEDISAISRSCCGESELRHVIEVLRRSIELEYPEYKECKRCHLYPQCTGCQYNYQKQRP